MKKLLTILILLLNFNISILAAETPKKWIKGKFYESVKDNLLVATKEMRDPKFKKSVIVMIESNKNGAWGLAINKPIGSILLERLINTSDHPNVKKKDLFNVKIPIFWGGPVDTHKIFILHSKEYKSETTINYNNISISSDYKTLIEIADNKGPKKKLVIIGISSWGEGQLEGEMEKDHWILSEINTNLIFGKDNLKKWISAISNGFVRL